MDQKYVLMWAGLVCLILSIICLYLQQDKSMTNFIDRTLNLTQAHLNASWSAVFQMGNIEYVNQEMGKMKQELKLLINEKVEKSSQELIDRIYRG